MGTAGVRRAGRDCEAGGGFGAGGRLGLNRQPQAGARAGRRPSG